MKHQYLLELGGENTELGKSEALELLLTKGYEPKIILDENSIITVDVSKTIKPKVIRRLGMTKRVSKIVYTDKETNLKNVVSKMPPLDIGKKTLQNIIKVIDESKTILWNGPAGYFEIDEFSAGSKKIAEKISDNTKTKSLVSIAGGGDTVAAINKFKCSNGFTYLSTAGGAFLELLEGKILPGIKALEINE